jgi:hypothetical protein
MPASDEPVPRPVNRPGGIYNTGMIIGSQANVSGAIAFGAHSRITQSGSPEQQDELARLDELLGELRAGLERLDGGTADDAIADVDCLVIELQRASKDRPRILQLMDRIMGVAGPVGTLVQVAESARQLIMALVH